MSGTHAALRDTLQHGGPVVWIILALSLAVYSVAMTLLLRLVMARREFMLAVIRDTAGLSRLRLRMSNLDEGFDRQRTLLSAMIAAAPLLGLLGTVTGMIQTFRHLARGGSAHAMGGLADGISEALIATAAGLAVAIPALLLLYVAHWQLQRVHRAFAVLEHAFTAHHV